MLGNACPPVWYVSLRQRQGALTETEQERSLKCILLAFKNSARIGNIPNGNPSASSPNPCRKMNVAGLPAFLSAASRTKGAFCAMIVGVEMEQGGYSRDNTKVKRSRYIVMDVRGSRLVEQSLSDTCFGMRGLIFYHPAEEIARHWRHALCLCPISCLEMEGATSYTIPAGADI